jgi:hypothetical protein
MKRAADMAFWLALAAPAVVTLALVLRYGVNVPYADQWTILNMLARIEAGTVRWSELFAQHNEHRMVFPKLAMIGLARLTRWNMRAEMLAGFALAVASLSLLMAMARPLFADFGPAARLWAAFTISALMFSLSQWENWLWGWQLQWFLATFAAIAAIALASWSLESPRSPSLPAGAALAVIVSQYSLASGALLWPLVGAILALHPRRRWLLSAWILVAVAATVLYLIGYERPAHHPSTLSAIERPFAYLIYIGNYLSGPIGRRGALGLVALASFATVAFMAARRHRHRLQRVAPWIALGGFAVGNAALTGIGRVGFGAAQALDSRYATIGALLTVAIIGLAMLALGGRTLARSQYWMVGLAAMGLTAMVAVTDARRVSDVRRINQQLIMGRDCLLSLDEASDECLLWLYPDPSIVRLFAPQLATIGWSGFGPPEARRIHGLRLTGAAGTREWRVLLEDGSNGIFDAAQMEGDALIASGWAAHPERRRQPRQRVFVVAGDRIVLEAETTQERPDVAGFLKDPSLITSGWSARVQPFARPAGPLTLRAYLVIVDDLLAPLSGDKRLP